jgi:hypothetical protein
MEWSNEFFAVHSEDHWWDSPSNPSNYRTYAEYGVQARIDDERILVLFSTYTGTGSEMHARVATMDGQVGPLETFMTENGYARNTVSHSFPAHGIVVVGIDAADDHVGSLSGCAAYVFRVTGMDVEILQALPSSGGNSVWKTGDNYFVNAAPNDRMGGNQGITSFDTYSVGAGGATLVQSQPNTDIAQTHRDAYGTFMTDDYLYYGRHNNAYIRVARSGYGITGAPEVCTVTCMSGLPFSSYTASELNGLLTGWQGPLVRSDNSMYCMTNETEVTNELGWLRIVETGAGLEIRGWQLLLSPEGTSMKFDYNATGWGLWLNAYGLPEFWANTLWNDEPVLVGMVYKNDTDGAALVTAIQGYEFQTVARLEHQPPLSWFNGPDFPGSTVAYKITLHGQKAAVGILLQSTDLYGTGPDAPFDTPRDGYYYITPLSFGAPNLEGLLEGDDRTFTAVGS